MIVKIDNDDDNSHGEVNNDDNDIDGDDEDDVDNR